MHTIIEDNDDGIEIVMFELHQSKRSIFQFGQ